MATTIAQPAGIPQRDVLPRRASRARAIRTLAARRAALTAHNPRQIAVPLVGPALLALVVAPALKVATGGLHSHIDYTSFVGVGVLIGHARAVARPARDGSSATPHAEFAPLQPRIVVDGRRSRSCD